MKDPFRDGIEIAKQVDKPREGRVNDKKKTPCMQWVLFPLFRLKLFDLASISASAPPTHNLGIWDTATHSNIFINEINYLYM